MPPHAIFLDPLDPDAQTLSVEGEEADHARRVKRLAAGDRVTLLDGNGRVFTAEVLSARRSLELRVLERRTEPPTRPALEVWSAAPKGPRINELIDALSQVGAASWRPMHTVRSVVDPGEGKLARLERIAHEACKQSGRAWTLRVETAADFDHALAAPTPELAVVLAAHGAPPYRRTGATAIRLLIGPEGGFTPDEVARARGAGVPHASFGPHTMRIEVAAPAAAAIILHEERPADAI